MEKLELYIPTLEELWFYQKMMSDPETMSYNANWDVASDGYHKDTGCIDFPESEWATWYGYWIGNEPERDWWDMGIVIYAPYRGRGYAVPALRLMVEHAFRNCGVTRLHNDFEVERRAALKSHLAVGFRPVGVEDGIQQLILTRDEYLVNDKKTYI